MLLQLVDLFDQSVMNVALDYSGLVYLMCGLAVRYDFNLVFHIEE